jgi:hypothetical protein
LDAGDFYRIGFWITWVLTFLIVWVGCSLEYGFLGFALAWMPAVIIAYIAAFLWPLIAVLIFVVALKLWG